MNLGNKLKLLRKNKGLSQRELSEISSVPIASLQRYELNKTHPNIATLNKLASALDASVDFLTSDTSFALSSNIGDNIRKKRDDLKMSQKRLAKKAGMNLTSLQAYEANDPNIHPSILKLQRIADVLNCWLSELVGTNDLLQSDGDLIFNARVKRNIQRKKLAQMLGITDSELLLMEEGILTPSDEIKKEIAEKLDFSIEEVFPNTRKVVKQTLLQDLSSQMNDDELIEWYAEGKKILSRRSRR